MELTYKNGQIFIISSIIFSCKSQFTQIENRKKKKKNTQINGVGQILLANGLVDKFIPNRYLTWSNFNNYDCRILIKSLNNNIVIPQGSSKEYGDKALRREDCLLSGYLVAMSLKVVSRLLTRCCC